MVLDNTLQQNIAESQESQLHEESLQLVSLAMATLSTEERTMLKLKYETGVPVDEIAAIYKIKSSAVKMRLKRSREKVQRLCAQV